MGQRSAYTPGAFCWADVAGADPDAQQRFYEGLFGWRAEVTPGGYWMLTLGGRNVAGMFEPPHAMSPTWFSYVSVEDADATAARVEELGGTVQIRPRDLGPPGVQVGRMAMLVDPQGAALALWQPGLHVGAQLVDEPGAMRWNALFTTDVDAAASFYAELFGWTGRERYQALAAADARPHWQVVFNVPDMQDAVARAEVLGGGAARTPTSTAIGDIAVVDDPVGASFGLSAG